LGKLIFTPSEFEQVFFYKLTAFTFIKISQVAESATGKMYKRGTFGASCPPLRSRFGVIATEN